MLRPGPISFYPPRGKRFQVVWTCPVSLSPEHQDQAALHLVKRRGALKEVDQKGLTAEAMNSLAPEWASFPTHSGQSAYGQPVKTHAELASFYSKNLEKLRLGA